MKWFLFTMEFIAAILLISCALSPTQTITNNTPVTSPIIHLTATTAPTQIIANRDTAEESLIRNLVENFGKRLQTVSLLSLNAAQEIREQYSEFVSASLLEKWTKDVSKAPGRVVSSPWPDHIEISMLTKEASDRYVISGLVINLTSVEITSSGSATKTPVLIVVQKVQGHWLIIDYTEQR